MNTAIKIKCTPGKLASPSWTLMSRPSAFWTLPDSKLLHQTSTAQNAVRDEWQPALVPAKAAAEIPSLIIAMRGKSQRERMSDGQLRVKHWQKYKHEMDKIIWITSSHVDVVVFSWLGISVARSPLCIMACFTHTHTHTPVGSVKYLLGSQLKQTHLNLHSCTNYTFSIFEPGFACLPCKPGALSFCCSLSLSLLLSLSLCCSLSLLSVRSHNGSRNLSEFFFFSL